MKWFATGWWLKPLILILIIVVLHLLSFSPVWVEEHYSTGLYPFISGFFRICTGWVPFSVGDVLYTLAALWLLGKIIHFFARGKITWRRIGNDILSLLNKCLFMYIWFLLGWGLNYYRVGLSNQLGILPKKYTTSDLAVTTAALIKSLNASRQELIISNYTYPVNTSDVFSDAVDCYTTLEARDSAIFYHYPSVKTSLYGYVGNYAGYLGYYNPFSGEAQINNLMPEFLKPFTTCHEIAHQCGYASESQASFAGFVAIKASGNTAFLYSAYFDLFLYANGELYNRDSAMARNNIKQLMPEVRQDIEAYKRFLKSYKNPVEPYITLLYSNYLKAHNQPAGINSYDEVVAWLIAYYKRYGAV